MTHSHMVADPAFNVYPHEEDKMSTLEGMIQFTWLFLTQAPILFFGAGLAIGTIFVLALRRY